MNWKIIFVLMILATSSALACNLSSEFHLKVNGTAPSFIPYSNERVNVFIGNETLGSLVLEDKILTELSCTTVEEPTYNVYVENKQVIADIFSSDKPIDDFDEAVSSGKVKIEGQSTMKSLKASITTTFIKIFSWF